VEEDVGSAGFFARILFPFYNI
jgi:hypothetical protein